MLKCSILKFGLIGMLATGVLSQRPAVVRAQLLPSISAGNVETVVHGVVTTKSGRPLTHAILYLNDLTPSDGPTSGYDAGLTAITDAEGRFTWNVPASISISQSGRSLPLRCWAIASDRTRTQFQLRLPTGNGTNYDWRNMVESSVVRCETRWAASSPIHDASTQTLQVSIVTPDPGIVTLTIRRPDGRRLEKHAIQVFAADERGGSGGKAVYTTDTDGSGQVHLHWFEGIYRLKVLVPGIGFGGTGSFEVLPGKDVAPAMPALAPFGQISGTVPQNRAAVADRAALTSGKAREAGEPDDIVTIADYSGAERGWYHPSAVIDRTGHWTLNDVLPGQHRIIGSDLRAPNSVEVTVGAGETVTGVRLGLPSAIRRPYRRNADRKPVSVRGTVTDVAGHAIASADVYAVCPDTNGFGDGVTVLKTATDSDGHYAFPKLPSGQFGLSAIQITASHAGLAIGSVAVTEGILIRGGEVTAKIALPAANSGLIVYVVHDGKPVANASVRINQAGANRNGIFDFYRLGSSPESKELASLLTPTATTGSDGRAVFTGLVPGLWNLEATELGGLAKSAETRMRSGSVAPSTAVGVASNVCVKSGETAEFTVNTVARISPRALRVLGPDGRPPKDPTIALGLSHTAEMGTGYSSLQVDANGDGIYGFTVPGLWKVSTAFRDVPVNQFPANEEPRYFGESIVAVSPSVTTVAPNIIRTAKKGAGSIRVRVRDARGRPIPRASVVISDWSDGAKFAGSADENGEIVFADMTSGEHTLTARSPEIPSPPSFGADGDPFPSDASLTGVVRFVSKPVTVYPDRETDVTVQAEAAGYVHGHIKIKQSLNGFELFDPSYNPQIAPEGGRVRVDPSTGEFVAGPFRAGNTQLILQDYSHLSPTDSEWWEVKIDVPAAAVRHVVLAPAELSGASEPNSILMARRTDTNIYGLSPPEGVIYLSDGVTPALGALVAVSPGLGRTPMRLARAGAAGKLAGYSPSNGQWTPYNAPRNAEKDDPPGPVLMAWLPGVAGAVVRPYLKGQPVHITLPAPQEIRGRVTVGGKTIGGLNSTFRVLAAYQGKGRLNELLSVEATPQADGSFVLGGLTPGVYDVQAARDNIWLSDSQPICVGSGQLPNIAIDIPPPGTNADLRLVDSQGRPLPGAVVKVDRPDGPLTDAIWPKSFAADSAGLLHLEGLIASHETFTVYAPRAAGDAIQDTKRIGSGALDLAEFSANAPMTLQVVVCR